MTTQVTFKQAIIFGVGFAIGSTAVTIAAQFLMIMAGMLAR
jgi:hypothetical protein